MAYLFDALPLPAGCRFTDLWHGRATARDRSGSLVLGSFLALPSDQHAAVEADFLASHLPFSLGGVGGRFPDGDPWLLVLQQSSARTGDEDQQEAALERSLQRALQFNPAAELGDEWLWTRADLVEVLHDRGVEQPLDDWTVVDLVLALLAECCGVPLGTVAAQRSAGCALPEAEHICQHDVFDDAFAAWDQGRLVQPPTQTCPECGQAELLPVVWGLPSPEAFDELQGEVVFGGCAVPDVPWERQCPACGAHVGPDPTSGLDGHGPTP